MQTIRLLIGAAAMMASAAALAGAADSVAVNDAYVRAVPPGQPNSAAFMVLANHDANPHAVVGGASPAAKVVELHTHLHEDGMMKMRRIEKIDVAAKGETVLKPGGLHVMLIGLKQDLKAGESVKVTLRFEDGSEKTVDAPVRMVGEAMNMNMNGGGAEHKMQGMHNH